MNENLVTKTATELSNLYASGEASPVEATQAVLAQIEKHNPTLNCFCLIDPDAALASARESEERWQSGAQLAAIDGVPTSIKDLTLTRGWGSTQASSRRGGARWCSRRYGASVTTTPRPRGALASRSACWRARPRRRPNPSPNPNPILASNPPTPSATPPG